jgi:hypothetical protein
MDITNEELFDSALTDEPAMEVVTTEQVEQSHEQPRDDHGRFAQKQEPEASPEPVAQQPAVEQPERIPEFRRDFVRNVVKEALDANNAQWSRQIEDLRRQQQPKPEPAQRPDLYENPDGFVGHEVRQQVDPIKSEIGQLREFYSRREAVREHGQDKVQAAYDWVAQGMQSRDPEVSAIYQRAMQSMDPFGEIVAAHQQKTVFSQIGSDPQAWFGKTLEERLSDPKFAGELMQKIQQSAREGVQPSQGTTIKLPPSLNRVAAAQAATDDGDLSDGALFRHAMR